jgi:anti-sigma-K factor RskA
LDSESSHALHRPDLAAYVLGKLDPKEREAFQARLETCAECAREVQELGIAPLLLMRATPHVGSPSDDLRRRVLRAVAAESSRSEPPDIDPSVRVGGPRWFSLRWAGAAAAVLVAGVILGGMSLPLFHPAPRPQIAAAPVIHLAPPTGSAAATARMHPIVGGTSIDLTVKGLAPTPAGYYYVCWLVGTGDTIQNPNEVSVGSFTRSGSAAFTVHWETGADLNRYSLLRVTLEPDDGEPRGRGPTVLEQV